MDDRPNWHKDLPYCMHLLCSVRKLNVLTRLTISMNRTRFFGVPRPARARSLSPALAGAYYDR